MFKRSIVCRSMALAVAMPGAAMADFTASGVFKNESAVYLQAGQGANDAGSVNDTQDTRHFGELYKMENSARLFLNGDIGEESSWHSELNMIFDPQAVNDDYRDHKNYSQQDYLRELYMDTRLGSFDIRVGKQQVVWGTADGIKLLDIINPTDFRELNQNTIEDARIPIWMLKAETDVGESGTVQFIVSQNEENKIAGLNASGDPGAPFIMKGVDTITGQVDGFLNIAPHLGTMAGAFNDYARFFAGIVPGFSAPGLNSTFGPVDIAGTTVQDFVDGVGGGVLFATGGCPTVGKVPSLLGATPNGNAACLNAIAQSEGSVYFGNVTLGGNNQATNLIDGGDPSNTSNTFWNPSDPDSAFEYFPEAAFGSFDSFVNLQTDYRRDYPSEATPNLGLRYKGYTEGGTNWSVNYYYSYNQNPSVSLHWEDTRGQSLIPVVGAENVITLVDSTGAQRCTAQGGVDIVSGAGGAGCSLVFEETVDRIHNLGASFDTSIDSLPLPVVVRGEFLYQKDVEVPVVDRGELAIGNMTEGLKPVETDFFKYVIGVDVTVLTNMLVSTQLIQFIDLDFVDEDSPRNATITSGVSYERYTGDPATMHLTNDLQKGQRVDNFVSLFFSKPFGPSQEHRWNNILIWEEGGGWWNRFDVEYTFTDELIGTVEWNQYWGDEDTTFGQFDTSSNFQVGIRYILE